MATTTKPTYIIDSSALMAHLLHEPYANLTISQAISAFYQKDAKFIAPIILYFEIGNVLKTCVKSHRLSLDNAIKLYKHFLKLPVKYAPTNYLNTAKTCFGCDLSYYDASYLSLYKSTHYPLLTLDKKLSSLSKI